jgi:hypothetical protein
MSAAEMRRLAAKNSKRRQPEPVPADIESWWSDYAPRFVPDDTWQAIRDDVLAIFEATEYRTLEFWKRRCSEVCAYLAWRHETGQPTSPDATMTFTAIDEYFVQGYTGTKESRNSVRSRVRKLAEQANPAINAIPQPVFTHNAVKPPYSPEEEARICRAVLRYREGPLRPKLCLIVGLSCGAGLDSSDFRLLGYEHITDLGEKGIRVDVPGTKARTVWARAAYEDLVRAGLGDGSKKRGRVIGGRATDRNSVASIIDNAKFYGSVPHIEVGRMRSTWLVWAMHRNLPLPVILEAAGLKSARSLTDLIDHVPATGGSASAEVLR